MNTRPARNAVQQTDEALEHAARWTRRLGLEAPAIFVLEMQKPMARFLGHGLEMVLPLVPPLWQGRARRYRSLLTDPRRIEQLIRRIEQGDGAAPPA